MSKEVVSQGKTSPARVQVSYTRKYSVAAYESIDVHVGLSDDCKTDESVSEAFDRVIQETEAQFEKLCGKIEGNKKGGKK